MCDWCKENNGEPQGCQECGKMICWDIKGSDDVISRPYVSLSFNVYCIDCGSRSDRDEDMDFENEDSNGVYIGGNDD